MPVRNGYHNGYVPAYEVITTIEHHLGLEHENWEEDDPRLAPLTGMWEFSDLRKQLGIRQNGGKLRWIPFGLADSVLCKLRLQNLWRHELLEIYEAVNLSGSCGTQWVRPVPKGMARCGRVGCSVVFEQRTSGSKKKYCSVICKNQAYKLRSGQTKSAPTGPGRHLSALRCKNGHERTPENTYLYKGKRLCNECRKERKREAYARERLAA